MNGYYLRYKWAPSYRGPGTIPLDWDEIAFEWRPSRRCGYAVSVPCGPVELEDYVPNSYYPQRPLDWEMPDAENHLKK